MAKQKKEATIQKTVKTSTPKKRTRKIAKHSTLKLTKKQHIKTKPLPGIKVLVKEPIKIIWQNKRPFIGLTAVYSILVFVLIKGLGSAFDIVQTKQEILDYAGGDGNDFQTSYSLFNYLLGSFNGQLGDVASTYQMFFSIIIILATIWLCRQLFNGEKPGVKDSFYKGMYPLIPFILVAVVMAIQLIPVTIGSFLFSTVISQELAVTFVEKLLWFIVFGLSGLISLYFLLSSIFALNIVTLPDVAPITALRSARELVLHRRIGIFARLLVLPIVSFLLAGLIFIPLILVAPVLVEPLFLVASCFGLVFMTTYLYNFYRLLL